MIAFATELALHALWSPGALRTPASFVHVAIAATAFAGAAVLAALGLFQIAAWRFAARQGHQLAGLSVHNPYRAARRTCHGGHGPV